MTINLTPNFIYEISDSLFQYRDIFKYYTPFPTYIVDYDDSIVAHATYLAQKAAGGFHDLKFNATKANYRIQHEFDWIMDPWAPYYRTGVLPLFFHYLNIHEIIQLMPGSAQLKINRNQLLDIARLIQFFETTRFIEATYMNLGHSFKEHQAFFIVITPAEILLYDLQEQLVAQLDFVKSKISYVGRQTKEFSNFYNYLKDIAFRFSRFMPVGYAKDIYNMVRPDWMRINAVDLNQPWNYLDKIKRSKFSHSNLAQLKKEYMKKYGLDYNDPEAYTSFNFRVITLTNPFWFKWGNKKIAVKHNVSFNSLPKNAAVELLNNKRLNLDNYNTPLLFKEAFKLIEDLSNLARSQHTKNKYPNKEYKNAYWNSVVDALYLKTAIIREDDVSNKKSIFHLYLPYNMGLVAPVLRRFAFKDGHITHKKKKRPRRGRRIPRWSFFWKRAGEQTLWMDQMQLEDEIENKTKWLGTRFLIRNKAEFWWNHTKQDTSYLKNILNFIKKRAQAIDAFDKDKKIATDHWYVQERNYHLDNLHGLILFYIRAHMSYIKSKTSDFFIEILTMDGLSLDRKLGLCQMYLDEVHLLSKKKNNYLIYKTEYEPASMLLLAIRQLKTEMGPLALQAHTNVLKNNSNVPSFINQKGQDIYFEDLCYGKIQKSTKGAVFDYFVEFKDLIQNLFIVKTFVRNGENVQVFYPKYTNKHGEALWYSKNRPFSKQLDFFHKKLLSFLEITKQDLEGTVNEFKNNYDLLISPKNGTNGFNTATDSKKLGNYWHKNFVASLFDSWSGSSFKYRWFIKRRNRNGRSWFKLRWFRTGGFAGKHIRRGRVTGAHQRSTWHSLADLHPNKHVFLQNQKALFDWLTIKWNNEIDMHDPGILTNYDDLGLDIEFDLDYSQTYNDADFYDEEAVRDEIELYSEAELDSVQSLEQEAVKKTHDLNILLSLLNESKTIIDKLKYDTDLDQKEVINFESEYQYSEEELSDLFDSKYFQNLITSFIWNEDEQEESLDTFIFEKGYELFETPLEDIVDLSDIDNFSSLLNEQNLLLHEKDEYFINKNIKPYINNLNLINDEEDITEKQITDIIQVISTLNNEKHNSLINFVEKYKNVVNKYKHALIFKPLGVNNYINGPLFKVVNGKYFFNNVIDFFSKLNKKTFPSTPLYKRKTFSSTNLDSFITQYIAAAKIKRNFNFLDTDAYILNKINNSNQTFLLNYLKYINVDPWFTKYLPAAHKLMYPEDFNSMSSDDSSEEIFMDSLVYTAILQKPEKTTQSDLMNLLNSRTLEERKKTQPNLNEDDLSGLSSGDENDYDYLYLEDDDELNFLYSYKFKLQILHKLYRYLYFSKQPEMFIDYVKNLFSEDIKFDKYYTNLYNKNLVGTVDWKQPFHSAVHHNVFVDKTLESNVEAYFESLLFDFWNDFSGSKHDDLFWTLKHFITRSRYLKDNRQFLRKLSNNTSLKSHLFDLENKKLLDLTSKMTRNFESNTFNKIKSNQILLATNPTRKFTITNVRSFVEIFKNLSEIIKMSKWDYNFFFFHPQQNIHSNKIRSMQKVQEYHIEEIYKEELENYELMYQEADRRGILGPPWVPLLQKREFFGKRYPLPVRNIISWEELLPAAKSQLREKFWELNLLWRFWDFLYKKKKAIKRQFDKKYALEYADIVADTVNENKYLGKRNLSFNGNLFKRSLQFHKTVLSIALPVSRFDDMTENYDDFQYEAIFEPFNELYEEGQFYRRFNNLLLNVITAEGSNRNLGLLKNRFSTMKLIWMNSVYSKHLSNRGEMYLDYVNSTIHPQNRYPRALIEIVSEMVGKKPPTEIRGAVAINNLKAFGRDDLRLLLKLWNFEKSFNKRYYKNPLQYNNTSLYDENSIIRSLLAIDQIENNFEFFHLMNSVNLRNSENLNYQDVLHIANPYYARFFDRNHSTTIEEEFKHEIVSEFFTNRKELKSLIDLKHFKNSRMFKFWSMNKMQNLTKKYFNMLNNSTVIKNNLINSGIKKRFLQYSEFPMWINNVLMNEKKIKVKNKNSHNDHFLIGKLISKLKYYNEHKDNISKKNLKDFEETYAKVLKLTRGLLSESSMSSSNSTIFRKKDTISDLFPNFEKVSDPNALIHDQAAHLSSKKNLEFYTPNHSQYFQSVILGEYRYFPHSKFIPEWLDLYQFEDFILSLMQTDQDFSKLYLLKVLQKQHDDEFIQPLFMAIIDRMQYSQRDALIKETVSKSSMWRRFFTKPVMKGSTPFELAISSINNSLLKEMYSISLMKEDSYIGNQYESFPEITEMDDINFSSISLNPLFLKVGPVLSSLIDMDDRSLNFKHVRYLKFKMILNLMFRNHFESKLKNILDSDYLLNCNVGTNPSYLDKINFNSKYTGVFVDSNMVNIDPKFDKYLHMMSLKGKDYQIIRNDKDQKILSEDTTYFSYNIFSFVKRLFQGWRSWNNFIK